MLHARFVDQVVAALLEESSELRGAAIEADYIKRLLIHPRIRCLVAVESSELLGTAILQLSSPWYAPARKVASDLLVWVAPERRGGSVFLRLIRAVESWAKRNAIDDLYLSQSTGIAVERTAELYTRLGYSVSGFISHKRINHVHRI